jgi:ABC-type bacteriocin/lantibiotic exporter with double-glycine peptidase domain
MSWFDRFLNNVFMAIVIICVIPVSIISAAGLIYYIVTKVTWLAIVILLGVIIIAAITTYQVRRDEKAEKKWYDNFNKHMEDIKNAEKK